MTEYTEPLVTYMRRNPPPVGSPAEEAWALFQKLPADDQAHIAAAADMLAASVPKMGLHSALEVVFKVGRLMARRRP